jgi:phospholipase C
MAGKKKAKSPKSIITEGLLSVVTDEVALKNLDKIDHIVVLMLENRSFDHMLGYLKLEGRKDVEGLVKGMSNSHAGKPYNIRQLKTTAILKDPCHAGACVIEQTKNNNGGFVDNFAMKYPQEPDPGVVMGYYNADTVPVFDHLAQEYCVCNYWYSSVPGETWPNRLYSVCGKSDGKKDNKPIPIYNMASFARYLSPSTWRWYCNDVPTLWLIDPEHSKNHLGNFYYFDRRFLGRKCFLDHAASGNLPGVAWIDPNFVQVGGAATSNDDHAPSNVIHGQELVLKVFNAVVHSPVWNRTVLVIVYDEHGGFYDHRAPIAIRDDSPDFRLSGLRVPAIVVSPWVSKKSTTDIAFDHTSIIKTILLKFCRDQAGNMGARVQAAEHLGKVLSEPITRVSPLLTKYMSLVTDIGDVKTELLKNRLLNQSKGLVVEPAELSDFQKGYIEAKQQLRAMGLPSDQP